MSTPLSIAVNNALSNREKMSLNVPDLRQALPCSAPDFFSNDYLSLVTNPDLRQSFLERLCKEKIVLGSTGSRVASGNPDSYIALESKFKDIFHAPAALLFNTGYDANLAFWQTLPQAGDAIIMDELVHVSIRDGVSTSRAKDSIYTFAHNSSSSLQECITRVLKAHPSLAAGTGTIFIAVESLYSMDGDFAPLIDIVQLAKQLIPAGCAHVVVDEAHSTGVFGPRGRGLVMALGLEKQVDTVIHVFSKARALSGGLVLTSPIIRKYLINYARPFIYSTSMPSSQIIALNASTDYIESPAGDKLRENVYNLTVYFKTRLTNILAHTPPSLLRLCTTENPPNFPPDIISPLFPIVSNFPISLANFMQSLGYGAYAVTYPVVPHGQGRIRVTIHPENTKEEVDTLISALLAWVTKMRMQMPAKESKGQGIVNLPKL